MEQIGSCSSGQLRLTQGFSHEPVRIELVDRRLPVLRKWPAHANTVAGQPALSRDEQALELHLLEIPPDVVSGHLSQKRGRHLILSTKKDHPLTARRRESKP